MLTDKQIHQTASKNASHILNDDQIDYATCRAVSAVSFVKAIRPLAEMGDMLLSNVAMDDATVSDTLETLVATLKNQYMKAHELAEKLGVLEED